MLSSPMGAWIMCRTHKRKHKRQSWEGRQGPSRSQELLSCSCFCSLLHIPPSSDNITPVFLWGPNPTYDLGLTRKRIVFPGYRVCSWVIRSVSRTYNKTLGLLSHTSFPTRLEPRTELSCLYLSEDQPSLDELREQTWVLVMMFKFPDKIEPIASSTPGLFRHLSQCTPSF